MVSPNTLLHCHLPYGNIIMEKADQVVQQSYNLLYEFNIYILTTQSDINTAATSHVVQHYMLNSAEILQRLLQILCCMGNGRSFFHHRQKNDTLS